MNIDRRLAIILAILLLCLGCLCGVGGILGYQGKTKPHCAEEDSCRPDWNGDEWVLIEVTP